MERVLVPVLALCGACSEHRAPPTEIVLLVSTDLGVPAALDAVHVEAVGPSGELRTSHAVLTEAADLPLSLRLTLHGGETAPLRVRVEGALKGAPVLERSARLAFVPGQRRVLSLSLLARCVGVTCAEGLSCGESGCANSALTADALPVYDSATFTALGVVPSDMPEIDADHDALDADMPERDAPPSPSAATDAERPASDAAADASSGEDAGEPAHAVDSGPSHDAGAEAGAGEPGDAGCERVLVCRGLCVPLTVPGLCSCTSECAPPLPT